MSDDDEQHTTGEVRKPFCPDNFIRHLQSLGYIRWDSCTWIDPKDIPVMAARRKIKRARRRRALLMAQRAQARE